MDDETLDFDENNLIRTDSGRLYGVLKSIISTNDKLEKVNEELAKRVEDCESRLEHFPELLMQQQAERRISLKSIQSNHQMPTEEVIPSDVLIPPSPGIQLEEVEQLIKQATDDVTSSTQQIITSENEIQQQNLQLINNNLNDLVSRQRDMSNQLSDLKENQISQESEFQNQMKTLREDQTNAQISIDDTVTDIRNDLNKLYELFAINKNDVCLDEVSFDSVQYLSKLPIYKNITTHHDGMIEQLRKSLMAELVETRSRIVNKVDKLSLSELTQSYHRTVERIDNQESHFDTLIGRLMSEKANVKDVAADVGRLQEEKADKKQLLEKADKIELTHAFDKADDLRREITNIWERLGGLSKSQSFAKADPRKLSISMSNDIGSVKIRLTELEYANSAINEQCSFLREEKLDRSSLKQIYTFLDRLTRRLDSVSASVTDTQKAFNNSNFSTYSGPSDVKTYLPVGIQRYEAPSPPTAAIPSADKIRPASTPLTKPSATSVIPQPIQDPGIELQCGVKMEPTKRTSPQRNQSPGNSRWCSGATFVRSSSGHFTSASITKC